MKKKNKYQSIAENKTEVKKAGSRCLAFSNSLEKMELDNYKNWLSLLPERHIAKATFFLKAYFMVK
jgi:hypothetical protein